MTRPAKLAGWFGVWCILPALAALPALPVMAAEEMEEVVVTGSYIKRDSFDSASPLTVISAADIEANATSNLGEVIVDQTYNYGSEFQTNTYAARSNGSSSTVANLRGLGGAATLELVDGKRTIQGNLNSFVPQIAIERIDVLKDGASALYGTDAVAGVINVITRKNFNGAAASFFITGPDRGEYNEKVYDFIMGSDTDNGHITVAGSYKTRGELNIIDRKGFARNQWSKSGTGHPGTWAVPERDPANPTLFEVRDSDGVPTGATTQRTPDPGCGTADGPGGKDLGKRFNYLSGELSGSTCQFHFGETWDYMNPHQQVSVWMNYQYDFTDTVHNDLDFTFLQLDTQSRGSPQNPGGRIEEFPIFLGDHPGNPFRAFVDAFTLDLILNVDTDGDGVFDATDGIADSGNGLIDAGEHLFAADADGDGVPDRALTGGTDGCGTFSLLSTCIDNDGNGEPDVILAANPFVQDLAAGDLAFNEDVDVIALRALGKVGLLPGANQPTSLDVHGANNGNRDWLETNWRVAETLTVEIPDTSWSVEGSIIWQEEEFVFETKNSSQTRLELGIRGMLDPDPDPSIGKQYWNPFSTQALACVDRICSSTGVPDAANSVSLLDSVHFQGRNIFETEFVSYTVVGTGDLVELPTGHTIQSAFGVTYANIDTSSQQGPGENSCDWHEGGCELNWSANQDRYAVFYEFAIPILDNLEVNLAGGYTDYGGGIGDSFDPKASVLYQPIDMISVRGSISTAFIAPSLNDQFGADSCGLQTMVDPLTDDFQATFRVRCLSGNSALSAETATVYNLGVSFSLLEGDLNLGVDFANYDFEDRIAQTTGQQVIDQDFQRFAAQFPTVVNAAGQVVPANPADATAWLANKGLPNGETTDLVRDSSGVLTRVLAGRINAQTMEHTAWDFYGRYRLDMGEVFGLDSFGTFTLAMNATFAQKFDFDLGIGAAGQGDGAGSQNETITEVPPMPKWRVNGSVNWFKDAHSAMVRVRHFAEFDQDIAFFGAFNPPTIEAMTYVDVNYAYTWDGLWGDRSTKVEIGARNVLDSFPEPIFNLGGIETFLHDIRGRQLYFRVNQDI